jgi:hypothetical protein
MGERVWTGFIWLKAGISGVLFLMMELVLALLHVQAILLESYQVPSALLQLIVCHTLILNLFKL